MKNKVFTEEVFPITMTKRVQYFVCFIRDHVAMTSEAQILKVASPTRSRK